MTQDNVDPKELFTGIVIALSVFLFILLFIGYATNNATLLAWQDWVIDCMFVDETIGCLLGGG